MSDEKTYPKEYIDSVRKYKDRINNKNITKKTCIQLLKLDGIIITNTILNEILSII